MSTLDQAVQRFKILKERLMEITSDRGLSNQRPPPLQPSRKCSIQKTAHTSDTKIIKAQPKNANKIGMRSKEGCQEEKLFVSAEKQNATPNQKKQNRRRKINEAYKNEHKISDNPWRNDEEISIRVLKIDEENTTQKKGKAKKHKKNSSCNMEHYRTQACSSTSKDKNTNARGMKSLNHSRTSFKLERSQKEKALNEINELLQKKKNILQTIEKKMDSSRSLLTSQSSGEDLNFSIKQTNRKRLKAPNLFQMQMEARRRGDSKSMRIKWK